MRVASKWHLPALGLAAGLAVMLVVLAALQYQWSGQVSEAQRERIQATLRTAMNQFREDLHYELGSVCSAFEIDPSDESSVAERAPVGRKGVSRDADGIRRNDYAERYQEWRRRTPYPDLIANMFLWEMRPTGARLFRLSQSTGKLEAADCPPRSGGLCGEARLELSELPGLARPPFAWILEARIPALVHPLLQPRQSHGQRAPGFDLAGYLVLELNPVCLQKQILAELVQRYFGSADGLVYEVAVLGGSNSMTPVYLSDAIPPHQILAGRDAAIQLFGPRHEDLGEETGERGRPGTDHHRRFALLAQNRDFTRRFRLPVIVQRPEDGRWQLVVKHRSGSVEDAVAAGRRRNLAVSFGILLVLGMSMAMLVLWTGRAQRLARLQVEFVAGVSHELRTPLAVISSAADNLAAGVVDAKPHVRQYGTLIGSEARRLSGMVQQILLFALGEAKQAPYQIRPVEIAEVVDRALSEADGILDEAAFTVEKHIQPGLPPALADAHALAQCLQNLISNALKYGRDQRWLGIRGRAIETGRGAEIELTIEDKGIGIDREDLPHIFEPFYRGRAAKAAQIHGTGLGLSLAKRITEGMGGRLTVISMPGTGTAFTLHLPAGVDGSSAGTHAPE